MEVQQLQNETEIKLPALNSNELFMANNSENKLVIRMKRKTPSEEASDSQANGSTKLESPRSSSDSSNVVTTPSLDKTTLVSSMTPEEIAEKAEKRRKLEEELAKYQNMINQIDIIQKRSAASTTSSDAESPPSQKRGSSPVPSIGISNPQMIVPLLTNAYCKIQSDDGSIIVLFDVAWPLLQDGDSRQTIYFVEQDKPQKGPPNNPQSVNLLRGTKGIFVYPPFVVQVVDNEGNRITEKERIKVSMVGSTREALATGNCACNGNPMMSYRSEKLSSFTVTTSTGEFELNKFQLGCLTGRRGHMEHIRLKVEFISEGTKLFGKCVYSCPMEIGAKGPFTKMAVKGGKKKKSEEFDIADL